MLKPVLSMASLLFIQALAASAWGAPPPPAAQEDVNNPAFKPCREKLARLVAEYSPLSHPPAPKALTREGDLTYDRALEYTLQLRKTFAEVKDPAFRRQCEQHLAVPNQISSNYHLAYTKMEDRLKWHEEALDKHCEGHIKHSRQQGMGWLTNYSNLKNTAAKMENSKSVVEDMAEVITGRSGLSVNRACEVFGRGANSPKLQALAGVCREEMAEYSTAHAACVQVCERQKNAARCDVLSK